MEPQKLRAWILAAIAVFLIAGLAYAFAWQPYSVRNAHTIKIVGSYPLQTISVGQDIVNGIQMAFDEVGNKVDDYRVEFVSRDDGDAQGHWQPDLEVANATMAAKDPRVMVYLAPFNSGAAKLSIPITNRAGLAHVSPGTTWPGLTQPGFLPGEPGDFYPTGLRTFFRTCPTDALQGPAGALWAKELGVRTVYVFDDGEAFGKGIAGLFLNKAQEIGLQVLGRETLDKTKTDFTQELQKLRTQAPDMIYFAGITPNGAVPLVQAVKALLPQTKFMGPDGIREQAFIDQAGTAAEGVYATVVGMPPEKLEGKGKQFYDAYTQKYGTPPGTYSVFGYEAARMVLQSIDKANIKDRAHILEEISKVKNYDGLFGAWSFDQNGDTTLNLVSGSTVHGGAFVFDKLLPTK